MKLLQQDLVYETSATITETASSTIQPANNVRTAILSKFARFSGLTSIQIDLGADYTFDHVCLLGFRAAGGIGNEDTVTVDVENAAMVSQYSATRSVYTGDGLSAFSGNAVWDIGSVTGRYVTLTFTSQWCAVIGRIWVGPSVDLQLFDKGLKLTLVDGTKKQTTEGGQSFSLRKYLKRALDFTAVNLYPSDAGGRANDSVDREDLILSIALNGSAGEFILVPYEKADGNKKAFTYTIYGKLEGNAVFNQLEGSGATTYTHRIVEQL